MNFFITSRKGLGGGARGNQAEGCNLFYTAFKTSFLYIFVDHVKLVII